MAKNGETKLKVLLRVIDVAKTSPSLEPERLFRNGKDRAHHYVVLTPTVVMSKVCTSPPKSITSLQAIFVRANPHEVCSDWVTRY